MRCKGLRCDAMQGGPALPAATSWPAFPGSARGALAMSAVTGVTCELEEGQGHSGFLPPTCTPSRNLRLHIVTAEAVQLWLENSMRPNQLELLSPARLRKTPALRSIC